MRSNTLLERTREGEIAKLVPRHSRRNSTFRYRMGYTKVLVALAALTSSVVAADQPLCSGLPVVTSEAAICRLELHFVTMEIRKVPATNQAQEHDGYWLVLHLPVSSGPRSGGARFKVDKVTGNVELVELLELLEAPAVKAMPNNSLERTRER